MDHVGESQAGEAAAADSAERFAFVTLVTSDSYVDGALVLLHSLRRTLTPHSIVCLATPSTLSQDSMSRLRHHFDGVIESDLRQSSDTRNLSLLGRPDLRDTLTKIQLWDPALFGAWSAICYLDADTLVRLPIDDIFDRFYAWRRRVTEWKHGGLVAASPDTGWPDCFNSGVMLLAPGYECHQGLLRRAAESSASFDGADQGLLNEHFADWTTSEPYRRLPFLYNATANVYYTYLPALQRFGHDVRVVHFIGISKPWHWERTPGGHLSYDRQPSERWQQLISLWWNIHDEHVSGWRYWKGPFDRATALGKGYHHITEPIAPAPVDPATFASAPSDASHYQVPEDHHGADNEPVPEVPDWDKDWSWAADRVHPFDYSYLMSHANAPHSPSSKSYQPQPERPGSDQPLDEVQGHSEQHDIDYQGDGFPAHNHDDDNRHDYANAPDQPHQEPHGEPAQATAPQWMGSQRPWEDVAREGWQHHGDFQPHSYDHAYVERHAQLPEPHHKHDHHWQPEYTPMPRSDNQPLYEATQVVLQQRGGEGGGGGGGSHDHGHVFGQSGYSAHEQGGTQETFGHSDQYHDSHANTEYHAQQEYQHHHSGDHGSNVSAYEDNRYHGEQQQSQAPDGRGAQSTTSSSPLHYPQPKSPIIVNPVALWESSEEQAQRRAWAQHMEAQNNGNSDTRDYPGSRTSEGSMPWAASAPRADAHIPPSAMDHIDSSQLPRETPWKISHVRHRPTGGEADTQPPYTGMQFKEGVANDANARDAAGQLLQRWNEAVIARNIQSKVGDIGRDQISHSAVRSENGTDAIRLETTVSCEAEDSKGERTVYRFTLSSTLDIGGALSPPASQVLVLAPNQQATSAYVSERVQPDGSPSYPNPATTRSLPHLFKGATIQPLPNERGVRSCASEEDGTDVMDLRQPENYREPAMSRRSSFVHMQPNTARQPHMSLRDTYNNSDQFAEADSRYWKLQRQLIDLEMRQQVGSAQGRSVTGIPPDSAAARNIGMVRQSSQKLDLASPPTPSYSQSTFKQNEQPQPLQRRPSAFRVADPATFASEATAQKGVAADDLDRQVQAQSRVRSRSSPRLAIGPTSEHSGTAATLIGGESAAYPKRSHSHSALRRVAVQNSAHAQVSSPTHKNQSKVSTRPVFITSSSDSAESDEESTDEVPDGETFKSAIGRSPTPFPRHLRKGAVRSRANTLDNASDVPVESKVSETSLRSKGGVGITGITPRPEPDFDPAQMEKAQIVPRSSDFGISSSAVSSPRSPGDQKIRPAIDWGDEDGHKLPPDNDRSLDAQWRRIVYGAPPPRASVTSRSAATATKKSADLSSFDAKVASVKPTGILEPTVDEVTDVDGIPTAAGATEDMGGDSNTDDSKRIPKKDTEDIVNNLGKTSSVPSTAKKPAENKPKPGARASPRKLHSTRSFLNLTSQAYETTSDSELDTSEAELQERFWARAMKPSKSGMSTPYSPGRRRSVAELSSLISPRDLEEWMQWQGEDSSTVPSRFAADEMALPAGDMVVEQQSRFQQKPITPPASKANAMPATSPVAFDANDTISATVSESSAGAQSYPENRGSMMLDVHNALDNEHAAQDSSVQFGALQQNEETTSSIAPTH
ncbi:glycogenin glucosyltransferase [Coemansia guatemalensis]|uniref:glycogenin glucosyltransferase n=1 Tax=Coemansia guatemalensis TaxID=2761395 RepID=A0A9W8HWW0_9FUNG|nr:glycogenin glucosyltransferase [Coemansia guatemalensis]